MRYLFRLALLAAIAWLGTSFWNARPIRHEPGVLIPMEPMQQESTPTPLPEIEGFRLTGVASYTICARVLGTKRYWDGPPSHLAPVDVALGWGAMSDQSVLDQLGFSMGNRFFFYRWENAPPIPPDQIMRSAGNNHVISANASVKQAIKNLRKGEVVLLRGMLVDVVGPDGYPWKTSRTRGDTGKGACEIFYVQAVATLPPDKVADLRARSAPVAAVPTIIR